MKDNILNNDPLLKHFEYTHLSEKLQYISMPFHAMAYWICDKVPPNNEREMTIRKLLEAKDCAVRSMI